MLFGLKKPESVPAQGSKNSVSASKQGTCRWRLVDVFTHRERAVAEQAQFHNPNKHFELSSIKAACLGPKIRFYGKFRLKKTKIIKSRKSEGGIEMSWEKL